jgi:choline-sulfatase
MDRPNILFVLPDQHRPDFLGTNPNLPVRTPTLDGLAARGVRFTNAVCPSPLCAPSRAALASGRNYYRCGVPNHDHDYPPEQPTYYRHLRRAGYQVAGVGKFDLHKSTSYWGPDGTHQLEAWGFTDGVDNGGKWDLVAAAQRYNTPDFDPYAAFLHHRGLLETHVADYNDRAQYRDTHPTPLPDFAYCDNWIARNALSLLYGFAAEAPWHLVVNFAGPHDPMDVTASMRARWSDVDFPPPHDAAGDLDRATHTAIRQNYAAMIENIDRHVASFLEAVEARGELDQTLVVYASDHGEMLGDHGRWGKKTFYQPSAGVPLIVAGPDVRDNHVSDALVSLHDLAPTFLDWADAAPLPEADAQSLRPVLEGRADTHREIVLSALYDGRMGFDGRYKLVEQAEASPRLFDLQNAPHEDRSIAADAPSVVERLQDQLRALPGVPAL